MSMPKVLIVEPDLSLRMQYAHALEAEGHDIQTAETEMIARQILEAEVPDVIILDPGTLGGTQDGFVQQCLAQHPGIRVLAVSARQLPPALADLSRIGAVEYLQKPVELSRLLDRVSVGRRALSKSFGVDLADDTARPLMGFIGSDIRMERVYAAIRAAARSSATVFLTGESGTGKALCAETIHAMSDRSHGPFVALNCGATRREAFAAALAPPGPSATASDGTSAQSGTLFLNEVCDLDPGLQAHLVDHIRRSTASPLATGAAGSPSIRLICSSSMDPQIQMQAGRLREELYYLLQVIPIHLPPLRDRGDDVIEIAEAILRRLSEHEDQPLRALAPEVRELFRSHPWPGNVRQLLNVVWSAVILHDRPVVDLESLPAPFLRDAHRRASGKAVSSLPSWSGPTGPRTLAEIERAVIEETIARLGGSVPQAARELDVSPSTLYRKIKAWESVERS